MLKKIGIMVSFCSVFMMSLQASLQIAIRERDFCAGNALVLIACDGNGIEQVAGCVSFENGKTQFSHEEISGYNPTLCAIHNQESAIVANLNQTPIKQQEDSLIYLYFEVDPKIHIVRALVIKNNFLEDNPYDVLEFSRSSSSDEDEDDFCFDQADDELSRFTNLNDITGLEMTELSMYDKLVFAACAIWTVQSQKAKQAYKKFLAWLESRHAE